MSRWGESIIHSSCPSLDLQGLHDWLGCSRRAWVWEIVPVALEVMNRDTGKRGTGNN